MNQNQDRRQEFIKKAEELRPILKESIVSPGNPFPTPALKKGGTAVFDFGNHWVGRLKIKFGFEGAHPDAPAFLKLKFCEVRRELDEDSSDYNGWISKGWIQEEWLHLDVLPCEIELPRRYAFRFVKIDVIDVSEKFSLIVEQMEARTVTSAEGEVAELDGNEKERLLDRISIRTLRNCMQSVFEDGPKRDRRLWIGDLRLQALANYETFHADTLVRRCLYLFAGTADDDGRVRACLFTEPEIEGDDTYIFDYSLFFTCALADYLEKTGDVATVLDLLGTAVRQVELARACFDENGLMRDSDRLGWCFLDWNLDLNKQAGAQFVYIYTLRKLANLLEMLGNKIGKCGETQIASAEASLFRAEANEKSEAAVKYLFDADKGVFVSGKERQISYASQVWAVLAGVFDVERNVRILKNVEAEPSALKMVTPYMYHHFVEALILAENRGHAYEVMVDYWGKMAAEGADTFYELFNPENPSESPYGSSVVNSYCHAWSCTPTYFMRHYHLVQNRQTGTE